MILNLEDEDRGRLKRERKRESEAGGGVLKKESECNRESEEIERGKTKGERACVYKRERDWKRVTDGEMRERRE